MINNSIVPGTPQPCFCVGTVRADNQFSFSLAPLIARPSAQKCSHTPAQHTTTLIDSTLVLLATEKCWRPNADTDPDPNPHPSPDPNPNPSTNTNPNPDLGVCVGEGPQPDPTGG